MAVRQKQTALPAKEAPPKATTKARATERRVAKAAKTSADELILDTAENLFAQYGFEAVTTKQLATEAGVTIGAIYHYFPSKDAIYVAAVGRAFSRRAAPPKKLFETGLPAEQRLTEVVIWFVTGIVADRNFGLLMRRELLDPRSDMPSLIDIEVFEDAIGLFKDLVRELVPTADPDEALASMLALVFGFANLKGIYAIVPSVRKTLSTPREIAVHATLLMLHGLRGQP